MGAQTPSNSPWIHPWTSKHNCCVIQLLMHCAITLLVNQTLKNKLYSNNMIRFKLISFSSKHSHSHLSKITKSYLTRHTNKNTSLVCFILVLEIELLFLSLVQEGVFISQYLTQKFQTYRLFRIFTHFEKLGRDGVESFVFVGKMVYNLQNIKTKTQWTFA